VSGSAALRSLSLGALAVLLTTTLGACRRDPPPRIRLKAIERCEDGIQLAVRQHTINDVQRVYHEECAGLAAEPGCARAFVEAAAATPGRQDQITLEACRKEYCPLLAAKQLEACAPGFEPTAESVARAWRPLNLAIIAHDTGGYGVRVTTDVLWFASEVRRRRSMRPSAQMGPSPPR
jgi:hypothetical protein